MMSLTIITALVLQLTGLWSHIPPPSRERLSRHSTAVASPLPAVVTSIPIKTGTTGLTLEPSASVYAVDLTSGQVLYEQDATKPRPIASITKLMTIMVALDSLRPNDIVTVGQLPPYLQADETLGLKTGERLRVVDLVKAALIPSDNDAADALALATSGTLAKFYAAMNQKASSWGITGAHFVSASGLIDTGNVVSAAGVAKIAELDLTNPLIRQIIATPTSTISDTTGRTFDMTTSDDLLATGEFYGIKTGYTLAAGECFVGLTKIGGHEVVTVVLGSSDRFGQTQTLVNWIGSNWTWL